MMGRERGRITRGNSIIVMHILRCTEILNFLEDPPIVINCHIWETLPPKPPNAENITL